MEITVEYVNGIRKSEHDVALVKEYKKSICDENGKLIPVADKIRCAERMTGELLAAFPVKEEIMSMSPLTRIGFLVLAVDKDYVNEFYIPNCKAIIDRELPMCFFTNEGLRLIRASLIEFAIMGCMEAQILMSKLNEKFGADSEFVEAIVNERCANLQRFVNAHEGHGVGVNPDDEVPTFDDALYEVKTGRKSSHWIWYICPQMKGIKGVHSRPAIKYGIDGRREAFEYINHPTLRRHLIEIADAILDSKYSVGEIFERDVIKVRSCMMLFASVSDVPQFKRIIQNNYWH